MMHSEVCLTCLGKCSKNHNINEIILENRKIIDLIRQLVPMIMEKQEFTLPNTICSKCLKELVISFKFQKKCLNSLKKFHKISSNDSPNVQNADNNIEHNSLNENSKNKDLKISIDQFSVSPKTASIDGNTSFDKNEEEKANKVESTPKNKDDCNEKKR